MWGVEKRKRESAKVGGAQVVGEGVVSVVVEGELLAAIKECVAVKGELHGCVQ